jgi:uncharacterized spore protein YtfJ
MKFSEVLRTAGDTVTVKQVYAEPYEQDGVTIIPAAVVGGGLGGGTGRDEKGQEGEGGGFGISARPAGAFVLKNGHVDWRPAVDPNRVVKMVGLVVIAYLLSRPRMVRARAEAINR